MKPNFDCKFEIGQIYKILSLTPLTNFYKLNINDILLIIDIIPIDMEKFKIFFIVNNRKYYFLYYSGYAYFFEKYFEKLKY